MRIRTHFISWIVASVVMCTMSYIWHGVFLNDFARISYPIETFLVLFAIVYLAIGLALTLLHSFLHLKLTPIVKGIVVGAIFGFFVYLIAFVFGVTFYASPKLEYVLMDFTWQMIEQGFGGLVGGYVFSYYQRRRLFAASFIKND